MFQFGRFPTYTYLFSIRSLSIPSEGLPHSDTHGSKLICSSPWLFAACRVLLRLPVPRHSPCALSSLNFMSFANLFSRSKCHLQTLFRVFVHCARCSFFTLTNSQPFLFSCLSLRIYFLQCLKTRFASQIFCLIQFSRYIFRGFPLWLAQVGSNHRPRAYQARALAC